MKRNSLTIKRICVFFAAALLLFSAIPISAEETTEPIKVACVGDSLTYGYLSSDQSQKSYPARLQTLLGDGYEVRNFGVNSMTMMAGYSKSYINQSQYTQSIAYDADIIIIMLGTNDSKSEYWNAEENENGEKFRQDTEALIASYEKECTNPRIIFATSPKCLKSEVSGVGISSDVIRDEVVPLQRTIAKENNWEMIDMFALTEDEETIYHSDGIHFSDAGYYYEAVCMYEAITGHPYVPAERLKIVSAETPTGETGKTIEMALDNDYGTIWHSTYTPSASPREDHYVIFELEENSQINGLYYLPRQDGGSGGSNGIITKYEIQISNDGGETFQIISEGTWDQNKEWKSAEFNLTDATHVKFISMESMSSVSGNNLSSAAEIVLIGAVLEEPELTPTPTPEPTPVPAENPFMDISENDFYYDAVLWALEKNVTEGTSDTEFSPWTTCTRGQVVTFLWRSVGAPSAASDTCAFKDIAANDYYYNAVLWAVEKGITEGTSDTEFSPDETCTRGQVVTFLWRFSGKPDSENEICRFTDITEKDYYYAPVLWAVEKGITEGTSDTEFSPDKNCTRGQVVTFLYRASK